jgi:hypothetical protein
MQIMHNFNIILIFLGKFSIDVLDLDMPFNCNAEISEPFKMKFIWRLQFWALVTMFFIRVAITKLKLLQQLARIVCVGQEVTS